mmetsp:Transcript_17858/g.55902  ORF Transcript_17858/g.55902 Transcript_17858/m.55902 type:complete len:225 (-) Transcript_17858:987-1661(-)
MRSPWLLSTKTRTNRTAEAVALSRTGDDAQPPPSTSRAGVRGHHSVPSAEPQTSECAAKPCTLHSSDTEATVASCCRSRFKICAPCVSPESAPVGDAWAVAASADCHAVSGSPSIARRAADAVGESAYELADATAKAARLTALAPSTHTRPPSADMCTAEPDRLAGPPRAKKARSSASMGPGGVVIASSSPGSPAAEPTRPPAGGGTRGRGLVASPARYWAIVG